MCFDKKKRILSGENYAKPYSGNKLDILVWKYYAKRTRKKYHVSNIENETFSFEIVIFKCLAIFL